MCMSLYQLLPHLMSVVFFLLSFMFYPCYILIDLIKVREIHNAYFLCFSLLIQKSRREILVSVTDTERYTPPHEPPQYSAVAFLQTKIFIVLIYFNVIIITK